MQGKCDDIKHHPTGSHDAISKRKLMAPTYPHIVYKYTSKRPPRERELLGNQAKKVALVKRFFLHF